jgi:hypothetical protein
MQWNRLAGLMGVVVLCAVMGSAGEGVGTGGVKLYVSPKGNDQWTGKLREPNVSQTDGPLATPEGARAAVRRLKGSGEAGQPITVYFRQGVYTLDKPFALGPEDSGSEETPITYAAYPTEHPVISGGHAITGWTRSRMSKKLGKEVWEADLPRVKSGDWWFRELFVGGERRPRTRIPHEGYFHFPRLVETTGEHAFSDGVTGAEFADGEIQKWKNLHDVEVVALTRWIESRTPLAEVDSEKHIATFAKKSTFRLEDTKHPGQFSPYYVENVLEALDRSGEWYLDRGEGKLYYIPKAGESPRSLRAVAPAVKQIVRITGEGTTPDKAVHHITFKGLTFRHAEWEYPPDRSGSAQAAWEVPGAVYLESASNCAFIGCTIEQVGTYGIEVGPKCRNIEISHCKIQDLGAGGVKAFHGSSGTTIADCEIAHGGRIFHSAVGVWIGNSGHNRVVHNHIFDFFYTGVSVGWTWGYGPSDAVDNLVEYNHIHTIGQGMLSDMGGIYTLGISPGSRLAHNLIHDVTSYDYGGWGIYPDEGTTHMLIENNVVYRTKTGGFHQHYGKENIVRNNVFALAHKGQMVRSRQEDHKSFDFTGNIVYFTEGALLDGSWSNENFFMDKNIYWNPNPDSIRFKDATFEEWKKRGHDINSLIADPLFVDPAAGNFSLKPESPAFGLGFQAIDLSEVGPRP